MVRTVFLCQLLFLCFLHKEETSLFSGKKRSDTIVSNLTFQYGVIGAQINSRFLMKTLKSVLLSINIPFEGQLRKVQDNKRKVFFCPPTYPLEDTVGKYRTTRIKEKMRNHNIDVIRFLDLSKNQSFIVYELYFLSS